METVFHLPKTTFIGGKETALPLKEIITRLENVYCKSIGAEYMHINNLDQINWIRQRLESPGAMELNNTEKRLLLARHATIFEILSFRADIATEMTRAPILLYYYAGSVVVSVLKGSWPRSGPVRKDLDWRELTCLSRA